MKNYENILVPTDGSEGTKKALEHAVTIADRFDATLHALYVVNTSSYSTLPADANWEAVLESLEEEGEMATEEVVEFAEEKGVGVIREIRRGVPHRSVLDYAEDNEIDLIVMGTHGKTGIDRLLLGSVTEKIVRKSQVPVLTVRMVNDDSS